MDPSLVVPLDEAKVNEAWEYLRAMDPEAREALRKKCLAEAAFLEPGAGGRDLPGNMRGRRRR